MVWFKVDDGFPTSKPVLRIPRRFRLSAVGLWSLAGAWSAKELTDGFVPDFLLEELAGTPALARRLVDCGLWEVVENGWKFRNWDNYQPTRADVMAHRDRETERKRAYRASKRSPGGTGAGQTPSSHVASGHPAPARPDPTRTAAAAAARGGGSGVPLTPDLEVLRARFAELTKLSNISWSHLMPEQAAEISSLIQQFGDTRLLEAARDTHRNAAMVQAFLPTWRDLKGPRLVKADPESHALCADCMAPKAQHRGPGFDHDWTRERSA